MLKLGRIWAKKNNRNEALDPGIGLDYEGKRVRAINKDGSFNVVRKHRRQSARSLYQWMLTMRWRKFFFIVILWYFILNSFFAILYLLAGVENLSGIDMETSLLEKFGQAFFFSVQTFTTLGYGHLAPMGLAVNVIATVESLTGILSVALVTGVLYGRFSRPNVRLLFSEYALISPHNGEKALMFRFANSRRNVLMEVDVELMIVMEDLNGEKHNRRFYRLPLEASSIHFMPLTWTIVHTIDEESPIAGMSIQDLRTANAELLILVKAFDDTFGQTVMQRHSYACSELIWGGKFIRAF